MRSSAGGPPSIQEVPDWMPKPDPAVAVGAPPPVVNAPPYAAPPPLWQPAPSSRSPLPWIAGIGVIALVLIGGGYWLLRDSTLFQQQPSAGSVVTPTNQTPQYDRADRIVNKILVPDLAVIESKLSQGSGACSAGGNCLAALENLEPALAKAVADIDSSGDPPKCIATELQFVRTDLSNMDKSALGAIANIKTGQDDYGRTMAAAIGRIRSQLQLHMPPLTQALEACPRT